MNVAAVEAWLEADTGLVADKLGPGQVARIARERIAATGCADAAAYVALLASTPAERLKFVAGVVVPETWFFRDRGAFDGLARHVTGPWSSRHLAGVFRVLSAPCSSGEEAYSLAMALRMALHSPARFAVDAVDISRKNIARAAVGIYGKNSFRGIDLAFRDLFFDRLPNDAWHVHDAVRAPVSFGQANLLADDFAIGRPLYDAIFCRNLLIYFDRTTQTRAFRALNRLLADDGLLAVGPAEAVLALDHGFSPQPGASMFLFRKASAAAISKLPAKIPPRPLPRRRSRPPMPAPASPAKAMPVPAIVSPPLEKLRALADAGKLVEAAALGASLLHTKGASAELCYLVAVVADAAGEARRAEEFYRKALYLAPGHSEAMAHLALIAERKGDVRAASALRARAHRAAEIEEVAS